MGEIQLICRFPAVQAGLHADVAILTEILEGTGHEVTITAARGVGLASFEEAHQPDVGRYDLNIFLEHCGPQGYLDQYRPEALIQACFPNPEWFPHEWLPMLAQMDRVFCKTRDCARVFAQYVSEKVRYTGFTAYDHYRNVDQEEAVFHGPGASVYKGTESVIACWTAFGSQLPPLHLYFSEFLVAEQVVDLYTHPYIQKWPISLDRETFATLQCRYPIHLCPSRYEGFGHYIHEAKSTGAVVVTTDAPPMNEAITPSTGILVSPASCTPWNLGCLYELEPEALAQKIRHIDRSQLKELGGRAREDFLEKDRAFRTNFPQQIEDVLQ